MRFALPFRLSGASVMAVACVANLGTQSTAAVVEASAAPAASRSADWNSDADKRRRPAIIAIGQNSNVCVTVHVDQRIWPQPLAPDSGRTFSGSLMAELRRLYERRGGSAYFPNSHGRPRFVTHWRGDHTACRDRETDVFVVAYYGPRADGSAFVFEYRLGRGTVTRSGRSEIDVAAGIRAGRIRGFTQRRTMTAVIYEDLLSRAPMILNHLTIQRD